MSIVRKEEDRHLAITPMEQLKVVCFHRVEKHEHKMSVIDK